MKTLPALILILGLAGCATNRPATDGTDNTHYSDVLSLQDRYDTLVDCVTRTDRAYYDTCAESSSGFEDMSGADAHLEGSRCAIDTIKTCAGLP